MDVKEIKALISILKIYSENPTIRSRTINAFITKYYPTLKNIVFRFYARGFEHYHEICEWFDRDFIDLEKENYKCLNYFDKPMTSSFQGGILTPIGSVLTNNADIHLYHNQMFYFVLCSYIDIFIRTEKNTDLWSVQTKSLFEKHKNIMGWTLDS